jgi:hypothetical protein
MTTQVKMLVSTPSHLPLVSVWRDSGVAQDQGFDLVTHFANSNIEGQPRIEMSERGPKTLSGEYQFMSGLHHQTYVSRARGDKRFVYIAQAQNIWDDVLVAHPSVEVPADLEGKTVVVRNATACVFGIARRALELVGVDLDTVNFEVWRQDDPDRIKVNVRAVDVTVDGKAAAAFVDVPFDLAGRKRGLTVLDLPQIPVIHNTTICTNREFAVGNEALVRSFLRSMVAAIHFFKTEVDRTCEILERAVAPLVGMSGDDEVRHLQAFWSRILNPKPYPHPLAVWNVYQADTLKDPRNNFIGPLELWDTGFLRDIDDEGFIDALYGGPEQAGALAVEALI